MSKDDAKSKVGRSMKASLTSTRPDKICRELSLQMALATAVDVGEAITTATDAFGGDGFLVSRARKENPHKVWSTVVELFSR